MTVSTETMRVLLSTLKDGGKWVHLGSSPVTAIEAAWQAESEELVKTVKSYPNAPVWKIELTDKGRKFIAEPSGK